MYRDTLSGH